MRDVSEIIIHCSLTKEEDNYRLKDLKIFCKSVYHYVIDLDGTIEIWCDENQEGTHCYGHNKNSISICYIGGLDRNGKPKDTRTRRQQLSMFSLLCNLKENYPQATIHGYNEYFSNSNSPCFDVDKELLFWDELFRMNDASNSICGTIQIEINDAFELATCLVESGKIKNRVDVLRSVYCKKYKFGCKKVKKLLLSHHNEDVEVSEEYSKYSYGNYRIPKSILEFTEKYPSKIKYMLLSILFGENSFLNDTRTVKPYRVDNKNYVSIVEMFSAWFLIKKTYPSSFTTSEINRINKISSLNANDLISYLAAYILLAKEADSIKDYNGNTAIEQIYNEAISGRWNPVFNYFTGNFSTNKANYNLLNNSRNIQKLIENDAYNIEFQTINKQPSNLIKNKINKRIIIKR